MTLHIGILAHCAEGATLCYRTAWPEGVARMGPHDRPEITLTGVAMHHAMAAWEAGDPETIRLLAAAAVEVAPGLRPMPDWRGGPIAS